MNYEKIKLTVEYEGRELDIQVSKSVTWLRLEQLLQEQSIRERLKMPYEQSLHFKIKNKQIYIEKQDNLALYPVSDGDYLEIVEKK